MVEEFAPRVRHELAISAEHLAFVRQALVGVVNESKGTAYKARLDEDLEVAGKTGTAQVRRFSRRGEPVSTYEQNDHAWFVGFAPAGNPRIAFAVLIEHGGHGGEVAAPIAMEIAHGYFETVAPGDRVAPKVGLARRRYSRSAPVRSVGYEAKDTPSRGALPGEGREAPEAPQVPQVSKAPKVPKDGPDGPDRPTVPKVRKTPDMPNFPGMPNPPNARDVPVLPSAPVAPSAETL